MDCPFKEQLLKGEKVCDSGYDHSLNSKQCHYEIFNQCQDDAFKEQQECLNKTK